jgi:hypothetical protein
MSRRFCADPWFSTPVLNPVPDPGFQFLDLVVPGSEIPVPGSEIPVPGSEIPVPGSEIPVPGPTRIPVPGSEIPVPASGIKVLRQASQFLYRGFQFKCVRIFQNVKTLYLCISTVHVLCAGHNLISL